MSETTHVHTAQTSVGEPSGEAGTSVATAEHPEESLIAEVSRLREALTALEARVVGLPAGASPAPAPAQEQTSRRGMLKQLGATAAGVAAATAYAATQPERAAADYQGASAGAGTTSFGILAYPSGVTPPAIVSVFGVVGASVSSAAASVGSAGVWGTSASGRGVVGTSNGWHGVHGRSASTTSNDSGVFGESTVTDPAETNSGVRGEAGGGGPAVDNVNYRSAGVYGASSVKAGVVGATSATGYAAIYGYSNQSAGFGVVGAGQGIGIYAATLGATSSALVGISQGGTAVFGQTLAGGTAGFFSGPVTVVGPFTVIGAKSAGVDLPDGTTHRMYCEEAPDPWFSDYGTARLANGRATVQMPADFGQVVNLTNYLVFLQAEGDGNDLFVAAKRPGSFEVQERGEGRGSYSFSYRVVARRKDLEGRHARMELVAPTHRRPPADVERGRSQFVRPADPPPPPDHRRERD